MYAYAPDELAQIAKGKWHIEQVQCSSHDGLAIGSQSSVSTSVNNRPCGSDVVTEADPPGSNLSTSVSRDKNETKVKHVSSFCFDARQIKPGDCFVALSGGARDGHDFIEQAAVGGASVAIVEHVVDVLIPQLVVKDSLCALGLIGASARARFNGSVVGVTGSCGKTSTKEMLRLLLGEGQTHATAGNFNNRIGVPLTLIGLDSESSNYGVIEAGINQPNEMQQLGEMIRSDLTIITNVGPAHLELLETIENVAIEKARLAQAASPASKVVFPSDLLKYPVFAALANRAIVLHPKGLPKPEVDVDTLLSYTLTQNTQGGSKHELSIGTSSYVVQTPSRGIATNAALAIAAASHLGVDDPVLQTRIAQWQPASNRGRVFQARGQLFYVDCYNANPASMTDALAAFIATIPDEEPRAYLLGAMNELGDSAAVQHESVGAQLILRPQDRAFFVGPQNLVAAYLAGALDAGNQSDQMKTSETIENIKSDIAQFKGALFLKGSRSYQLENLLPEVS